MVLYIECAFGNILPQAGWRSKMSESTEFSIEIGQSLGEQEERSFEEEITNTNPSSTYTPTYNSSHDPDQILPAQDLVIQLAAADILDDTADEDISTSVHYEGDIDELHNKLQVLQRQNIAQIVKDKNLQELRNFGGITVIAEALNSDLTKGISSICENIDQKMPSKFVALNLLTSFLGACKKYTIALLLFSAVLSLTFGNMEQGLSMIGCFDGAVVLLAMFILIIFATIDNFFRDRRSQKKLDDSWKSIGGVMEVQVVRGDNKVFVPAIDLQDGDVVILRSGDQVPADGIFAYGQQLLLEGSNNTYIDENNPFLFYSSRVINGDARMIVTSVGMNTVWGKMMIQAMKSSENKCILETMLHKLDRKIQNFAIFINIFTFILLLIRYKIKGAKNSTTMMNTILDDIKGLITGSMLVGLLDGLPSLLSVAFVIWNHKTRVRKATVKDYLSCVKIASVTTVCTDIFGGLHEQEMEIDKFFVGGEFVSESSKVASNILEGLCDGIGTLWLVPPSDCESKPMPLILWAETKLGMKKELVGELYKINSSMGCNPFEECCGAQIEKREIEGKKYVLRYGPPQHILPLCSEYYSMKGNTQTINAETRRMIEHATQIILAEGEAIGFACRWFNESDEPSSEGQSSDLTFLGMIGLKDIKIEKTKQAVTTLNEGRIKIIFASGDDVTVLQTIAQKCGLLNLDSEDHLVVTAEEFRTWSYEEKIHHLKKISIIGNCIPSDKILLIKHLQEKGEVVALLGQRTADAPGLKQADIGLTFGTWSSEVARDCCDISISDGDFTIVVNVIEDGRCFYENIQNFIQLELIIIISSTLINFITTTVLGDTILTPIELLWLNLVVPVVGGLALLTIPSTEKLMEKLPVGYSSAKLLTENMWRNIVIQVSCQTTIFVTFQYKGCTILGESEYFVKSTIFNGFFLCQILNIIIARVPAKYNIFSHLNQRNRCFLLTLVLLLLCHAVFVLTESVFFYSPVSWKLWGLCLLFAFVCWLLDLAGKILWSFVCTSCLWVFLPAFYPRTYGMVGGIVRDLLAKLYV